MTLSNNPSLAVSREDEEVSADFNGTSRRILSLNEWGSGWGWGISSSW